MDIEGQLEAKVDMKPPVKVPVKIEGGFTIAYKDHEVDNLNETTIRVWQRQHMSSLIWGL